MIRLPLLALAPFAIALPAQAQDHTMMPGMQMPGMPAKPSKPAPKAQPPKTGKAPVTTRKAPGAKPKAAAPRARASGASRKSPSQSGTAPARPGPGATSDAGHSMQSMPGMDMSQGAAGHDMSAMPPAQVGAGTQGQMGTMPNMPGHDMPGMAMPTQAAQPEIPQSPPPSPPKQRAADRYYSPAEMDRAEAELRREHGGSRVNKVMLNVAEYQARSGGAYRWDGEAWYGGDLNRLVLKSEGRGTRREGLDEAELEATYSRAVGVYTDLQVGVRHDFKPSPSRTFATVGFETLVPYWFEVEGALYLSNKGEVMARGTAYYDLRLTERLILQPRAELNFAAQSSPEIRTGSGLSNAELGLRLRYEIRREFAPYIGVSYDQSFGKTKDYVRAAGERARATSFVVGLRSFF